LVSWGEFGGILLKKGETIVVRNNLKLFLFQVDKAGTTAFWYHSGGVRIIYYFHSDMMPLYLLTVFGKNERANISMKEKQILSKLVKEKY